MSYLLQAYCYTVMLVMVVGWHVAKAVSTPLSTEDWIMHTIVSMTFLALAYIQWREIAYTLSKNRYCKCGHLRGRHNNDKHCLQEIQSLYPINAKVKDWVPCECTKFHHDWSVVK